MQKAFPVVYIDAAGKEHAALVFAAKRRSVYRGADGREQVLLTPVSEGDEDCFVSGVYVDAKARESESIKQFYDVPHFTDESKQEPNPALPSYQLNCWKEFGEEHNAIPTDHPNFDHPFHREFVTDANGNVLVDDKGNKVVKEKDRPLYDAHVAAHQALPETKAAMAAAAAAQTPAYGRDSEEFKNAVAFLMLRGYDEEAAEAIVFNATDESIKQMSDAKLAYDKAQKDGVAVGAIAADSGKDGYTAQLDKDGYTAQLEAAVDQASDALFKKDAEIEALKKQLAEAQKPVEASSPEVPVSRNDSTLQEAQKAASEGNDQQQSS